MSDEIDRSNPPLPRGLEGMPIGGAWHGRADQPEGEDVAIRRGEPMPARIDVVLVIDGQEYPAYALRPGHRVVATELRDGRLTAWIEGAGRVPESDEVVREAR